MQDTLTPHETDPHDAFEIAPGVVLAARAENPSPNLAPEAAALPIGTPSSATLGTPRNVPWTPHPPAASNVAAGATPSADTTFRVTADDHVEIPSASRWAPRIFMTLFAICGAAGAAAWPHYSDAAKQTIADWIPPLAFIAQPSSETPAVAAAPAASPADGSPQPAADQASAQPAPAIRPAPGAAPTTAAVASAPADLAAMGQQIEQLKASIEQLKAGQEKLQEKLADQMAQQTSRDIARKPESSKLQAARLPALNARPRLSALPPQPARKPRPEFSPAQTAAILAAPRASTASALPPPQAAPTQPSPYPAQPAPYNAQAQVIDRTDGDPVGRPPMPLR